MNNFIINNKIYDEILGIWAIHVVSGKSGYYLRLVFNDGMERITSRMTYVESKELCKLIHSILFKI